MIGLGLSIPSVAVRGRRGGNPLLPLFANGEGGDAWVADREWCYTKSGGGVYEQVTTSGDEVARWTGMASGINLDQDVFARRPIYTEGSGLSWIETDGVDDTLISTTTDFMSGAEATMVSAVDLSASAGDIACYRNASGTGLADYTFRLSGNPLYFYVYNPLETGTRLTAGSDLGGAVLTQHGASSTWISRQKGVQLASRTAGASLNFDGQNLGQKLSIGSNGNSDYRDLNIFSLLFINRELDQGEINRSEKYFANLSG